MSEMPTPPSPFEAGAGGGGSESNPDAKMKGAVAHALPLADIATGFLGTVGLIVMYVVMKDKEPPSVVEAMKQSLYLLIATWLAGVVVVIAAVVTCGVGGLLALPLAIGVIVLRIMAAMKVYAGEPYQYPFIGKWTFLG